MKTHLFFVKTISPLLLVFISFSILFSCSNRKGDDRPGLRQESYTTAQIKRILFIDSYHAELPWVEGITSGIFSGLNLSADDYYEDMYRNNQLELKIFHMDSKRNMDEEYIRAAALEAKSLIELWNPDVVIASDDNASKYLIAPYYKGGELPFVFCGVNWDASVYGFPSSNVTGMVEVALIPQLVDELLKISAGPRVGLLKGDSLSTRREGEAFEKALGYEIEKVYVDSFSDWKKEFLRMQSTQDLLLIGNLNDLNDWNEDLEFLKRFVFEESKIPCGSWDSWMAGTVLITIANQPEELGEWAASAALKILDGVSPSDIPIETNKKAKVFLNMDLAKKMEIRFSEDLMKRSHLVNNAPDSRKVLFVNSYHKGYAWSDEVENGFFKAVDKYDDSLDIRILRMDTKNNNSAAFIDSAVSKVRNVIDSWNPDVVVGSDDIFSKYVVAPFYKDSAIPFVFCGVNWSAAEYGFPVSNVTGMVEVDPIEEIVALLSEFADGPRVAVLSRDDLSSRKIIENVQRSGNPVFSTVVTVNSFEEWKKGFLEIQNTADSFILMNPTGLEGWNEEEALLFTREHTKIPSGVTYLDQVKYSLLGMTKIAEEQGWWAGNTALQILDGLPPSSIPIAKNKLTRLIVNMPMANHMGIKFSPETMKDAILWNELSGEEIE